MNLTAALAAMSNFLFASWPEGQQQLAAPCYNYGRREVPMPMDTIYQFSALDIDNNTVSMNKYRNQVVMIVNVAANWGYTPENYEQMQPLYDTYKNDGFAIAIFPCNQFKDQEPGNATEIKNFVRVKYNSTYDLYAKIEVNGRATPPLYDFLKNRQFDADGESEIKWNFAKFLINRQGVPVRRYLPQTPPYLFEDDIVLLLGLKDKKEKPPLNMPRNTTSLYGLGEL